MATAVVTSPRTLLGILLSMMLSGGIFLVKMPSITVGDTMVPLTKRNRATAAAFASLACLVFTGALLWLLIFFSAALLLVLAHMALRPRTLAAKYNAATDDIRHMFFGPATSSSVRGRAAVAQDNRER